ncbi:MAG: tRNA epoxyqueuosine(34) reductase QueG [Stappiaceae bacterium]
MSSALKRLLGQRAEKLGFDGMRVTRSDSIPDAPAQLQQFLELGYHGTLDWLSERTAERTDPRKLWPDAKSVIVLGMNYGPETDPLAHLSQPEIGGISVYARHRDYHDIIKGRLKELAGLLVSKGGGEVKVFVDTAPVMEKPLAAAAGLGWQGKHTNLVSREFGSWFFLGVIFTSLELEIDDPEEDHCGSCRACLDICPTDAFPGPYQLDGRRCISYLTIEHHGPIPMEFRKSIGNRIYGCDDCLAVCPWNKFAVEARENKLKARDELNEPALADLLLLDDTSFRRLFSGSPIKRIGRDRFIRNVLIAAGNSEQSALVPSIEKHLDDPASIVRGAAVWALSELADREYVKTLKHRFEQCEVDPSVVDEWRAIS